MIDNKRMLYVVIVLIGLAALAAGVGSYLANQANQTARLEAQRPNGLLWPQVRDLPAVELIDQEGERFGVEDFRGHWSLVFFGFTFCPDICPMTLASLNEMQQQLAAQGADIDNLQTILVSVDPERDTPARLNEYVSYFNEDFIGVTGTEAELQTLTRGLGAVYVIEEPDAAGDYLIDHSASIFLINPQGQLTGIFTTPHEPASLAERLRGMLDYIETNS